MDKETLTSLQERLGLKTILHDDKALPASITQGTLVYEDPDVPEDIQNNYGAQRRYLSDEIQFNSRRVGVWDIDEDEPSLTFYPCDYLHYQASLSVYEELDDDEKERLLDKPLPLDNERRFYSSSFGVSLSVVTADFQLAVLHASEEAMTDGELVGGVSVGVDAHNIEEQHIDLQRAGRVALNEELGLPEDAPWEDWFQFNSLNLMQEGFKWELSGYLFLGDERIPNKYSYQSDELKERFEYHRPREQEWELEDIEFLPVAPSTFSDLTRRRQRFAPQTLFPTFHALHELM